MASLFLRYCSATSGLETMDLYTSHGGLFLEHGQSLARRLGHATCGRRFVTGAHGPETARRQLQI